MSTDATKTERRIDRASTWLGLAGISFVVGSLAAISLVLAGVTLGLVLIALAIMVARVPTTAPKQGG